MTDIEYRDTCLKIDDYRRQIMDLPGEDIDPLLKAFKIRHWLDQIKYLEMTISLHEVELSYQKYKEKVMGA